MLSMSQSPEVALNNPRGFAHEGFAKPAGGWLQTAYSFGSLDLEKVLNEEAFQGIKSDPDFQHFIQNLK